MAFDLFQSRRNMNERCRWWTSNKSDEIDPDELIYKRIPSGKFYAREVNTESYDDNIIGGIIMIDRTSVTIMSADDLGRIKSEDIVEYQKQIWRVDSIQKKKFRIQNSEFARNENVSHYWYLTLIK